MRTDLQTGSAPLPPRGVGGALSRSGDPVELLALALLNQAQPHELETAQPILVTAALPIPTLAALAGLNELPARQALAALIAGRLVTARGARFIVWDREGLARVALGG